MELSETEKAYLAGIVDGEGCILVEHSARSRVDRKMRSRLALNINNTNRELIYKLRELAGNRGSVLQRDPPPDKNWKKIWIWVIKGGAARWFIGQVAPYLIVKRDQAELALNGPDTEEKWLKMKALNQRGREVHEAT